MLPWEHFQRQCECNWKQQKHQRAEHLTSYALPIEIHALHLSIVTHSSPLELPIAAVVGPIQWCFPNVCFTFGASPLPAPSLSLLWLLGDENVPQSLGLDLVLLQQTEQRADLALGLLQVPGSCPSELCLNLRAFCLLSSHTSKRI